MTLSTGDTLATNDTMVDTERRARSSSDDGVLDAGERIGRYFVIQKLGAGGMGVVYAAYDPKLDRKVALKLLAPFGAAGNDLAHERLRREARALAKLAHPNVVGVYDVDVHEGQLYVAMEFIAGRTLGAWLRARERPWTAILDTFIEAGQGLASAHAAGLIHRDFKPDNVMVAEDGRVRVMDFGLARTEMQAARERPTPDSTGDPGLDALQAPMTRTGSMMGTPAYMAPEQFEGEADARSDQFGFCVALYEALHGERPFPTDSLAALLDALSAGRVEPAPRGAIVPAWLRVVVVRGLAADPNQRWPSMDALLDALADNPALRRRRWGFAALAAGLVVGLAFGVTRYGQPEARTCLGFEGKLVGIWDEAAKSRAEAAFEGTGLVYASDSFRGAHVRLDDYTQRWVRARRQACEATERGEQSGELLDRRMACLDERLRHVAATAALLEAPDEDVVREAVEIVTGLPRLDRCADIDALAAEHPPPEDPSVAACVEALGDQLIEAETLERSGQYDRGLELATSVAAEAEALDYAPLRVRAWLIQGALQRETGAYEEAEATFERAYASALASKMLPEAADAARNLMYVVGNLLARFEDGHRWAKHAEPLTRAEGSSEAESIFVSNLGVLAHEQGEFDEARAHFERALAIRERVLGPDHPELAKTLAKLGVLANDEGKFDEARGHQERALELLTQSLGPNHPALGKIFHNLGSISESQGDPDAARAHYELALSVLDQSLGPDHPELTPPLNKLGALARVEGRFDEARAYLERALAIRERAFGPDHPDLAGSLNSLSLLAQDQAEFDEARAYQERALAIYEAALGSDHPRFAVSLLNLGLIEEFSGNLGEARNHYGRAATIFEEALGADHPYFAIAHNNLGSTALQLEQFDEARSYFQRALAIRERAHGPVYPKLAFSLTGLGRALLGLDLPGEALGHLERALELRTTHQTSPARLAVTRFALARALWDAPANAGRDRPRARALAELAAEAHAGSGQPGADALAEIRAWQAAHAL